MKKTCEEWMEEYLMLDKGERVPSKLSWHLLTCKKCRKEVKALKHAEELSAEPLKIPTPLDSDTINAIMNEIDPDYMAKKEGSSLWKWIFTGIAMIAAMCFFTLLTSGKSNNGIMVAFYLVFAGVVSGYCATFVGMNLEFFIKKVNAMAL